MRLSLVPPRSYRPEILDGPGNRYEDLAPALRDIGRVNRWLGGSSAIVRSVRGVVARLGLREFSLLDVGTGGGDVPRAVLTDASRRGIAVHVAGIDLDPHIVRLAACLTPDTTSRRPSVDSALPEDASYACSRTRSLEVAGLPSHSSRLHLHAARPDDRGTDAPAGSIGALRGAASSKTASDDQRMGRPSPAGLSVIRGDAFALPFSDRTFDFVTCSLFLHHFHEREASRLLAEFGRVARRAVVVNDLARHFVPWAAISVLAALFAESPMFRHDAPLSVLRGWTTRELLAVAEGAGLRSKAHVSRRAPYRIVLCVEKEAVL